MVMYRILFDGYLMNHKILYKSYITNRKILCDGYVINRMLCHRFYLTLCYSFKFFITQMDVIKSILKRKSLIISNIIFCAILQFRQFYVTLCYTSGDFSCEGNLIIEKNEQTKI
jgi:hypothetical protein